MLDAVIDYLPSPLDVPAIKGINPKTDEETDRPADDEAPFASLAFKVMTDPFVGRLTFFRVFRYLELWIIRIECFKRQARTYRSYPTNARQHSC